ncbi:MAG: type 4a pilus biogenesis protein PilO [Microgenomates group bacterium]
MMQTKIFKNIFSKKTTDYTFAVLFFLIFSIFIIFAIKPSLTTVFSLKKEESDLKRIDALYEDKIVNIASIQSQIEENREDLPLLDQALPSYPQVTKMIDDVKTIAEESSIMIKKADVSNVNLFAANKKNLEKVKITVEGVGSFEDILKLTSNLFNQRRLKTIKKMIISSDMESTTAAQLKVTLEIEGYYL